jgi:glutamate 5-kinase
VVTGAGQGIGRAIALAMARGGVAHPLTLLREGARCTWFLPQPGGRSARKRWIAGSLAPLGRITLDAGAVRAIARGSSLLPAGITHIEGQFERGDPVEVIAPDGAILARGLCAYSSADAAIIAGHRTDDIETLLGWRGRDEIMHRDDLVLLDQAASQAGANPGLTKR